MKIDRSQIIRIVGVVSGILFIVLLDQIFAFMEAKQAAKFLLGRGTGWGLLSEQNVMWVVFTYGIAEVLVRYLDTSANEKHLHRQYLPEGGREMLQAKDLGDIVLEIKKNTDANIRFLPRLIHRVSLQFQSSRSVDQANSLLNSSLELFMHEIDLRYTILRYLTWLLPTLGFIGTVRGIALALATAGAANPQDPNLLRIVTSDLALAFDTTLLALLLSIVLVMALQIIQSREEQVLNRAGVYCVDNLINRLYEN